MDGKTILITGCSSGIGLCAALALHKKGYRVFAAARKEKDVEQLKNLGLESVLLDIDDSLSIQQGLQEVLHKTGGTLDALFNNAGFGIPGAVEDITREMMRAQFETNVFGTMELTNAVLPIMRKQGHGRIIQNVSILGIVTMPYRGVYNASKFALEGFSKTLRQELHGTSIHVSLLEPGPIESAFRKNTLKNYQTTLKDKPSVHRERYNNMEKYFFRQEEQARRFAAPTEIVIKQLIAALESRKPKEHYYVGFPAHVFAFLRRILPDAMLEWILLQVSKAEAKE